MVDFLRSWILNITVITVFVMLLDTIMPNSALKRYINVLIGLLIIIVVTKPFMLIKDYAEVFDNEITAAANYIDGSGINEKSGDIARYQKLKALEIYESRIKDQVIQVVEHLNPESSGNIKVNLEIDKEYNSQTFGQVKFIKVSISRNSNSVIEVNKIKIGSVESSKENKNVINKDKGEYNLNDRQLCRDIENGISRALGINEINIAVEVRQ